MAKYTSDETTLKGSAENVYSKISNPDSLRSFIQNIPADTVPEDKRQMLESIELSEDTLSIAGGPAGKITLKISRREPYTSVEYEGVGTPVRLALIFDIIPENEISCRLKVSIDADLPAILRPMVSGAFNKAVGQLAQVLATIPSWN